jgi:NADH dehydrogenase [ubiquinone] 1 alpha subcomplex assembly factor 5
MTETIHVFNRAKVRHHRDRAAALLDAHGFLFEETADRLADRLDDITHRFPLALDLGCHGGEMGRLVFGPRTMGRGGIETLIQADLSPAMARRARAAGMPALAADEEFLPFADATFDAVLSNLSLHWVNDLPGALLQIRKALKPDGLFLASMLGGGTLAELRDCLAEAEIEVSGGLSPRVSPFADVRDLGGLLQRAGFSLPVVDADEVTVSYETPMKLLHDLRAMGESNAVAEAKPGLARRDVLARALAMYEDRHRDADGRFPATFRILTLTAWAPAPTQQQALAPGSARTRLADALGAEEISLGEKAQPKPSPKG